MGNRLCKKKNIDVFDNPEAKETTFDKLFTRLHLRPKTWTSDSQLNKKLTRSSKCQSVPPNLLQSSNDYVGVALEVPDSEPIVSNGKSKQSYFSQDTTIIPVAPPRKRRSIKENIEAVARSSLQILQTKKPVDEPLCIKKIINYDCPCDKLLYKHTHQDHRKMQQNTSSNKKEDPQDQSSKNNRQKDSKRKKNLSVVSLPNYSELKFSLADFSDISKKDSDEKSIKSSHISLPFESKFTSSKNYMVRCRSFGSILPQQLLEKLKPSSNKIVNIESDDSFGPLEDWNLELIEHYNPRDASLPRPRKPIPDSKEILSGIESSIVQDDTTGDYLMDETSITSRDKKLTEKLDREETVNGLHEQQLDPKNETPLEGGTFAEVSSKKTYSNGKSSQKTTSTPIISFSENTSEQKLINSDIKVLEDFIEAEKKT